jgi:Endonuclease/Exonuclease/phosphatase family
VPLVVATANVLGSLRRLEARVALAAVLEHTPDLVALQEWHPWRAGLLGRFADYQWFAPLLGGCAVGARRDRFARIEHGTRVLSRPGRADRDGRALGVEPARLASRTVQRDLETGATVALVDYHLVSQVQGAQRYRDDDRPALVARHRRETAALLRLVDETVAAGHPTYACGDSNFHGFRIPGLVSAWEGRTDAGGTLGPTRQIDDVHAPAAPIAVVTVATPSDHLAVVATYA